ncbi:Tryptophan--tRNA ligase, mitochondrial [Microbotryomycetes sp. JL221]|nr:Tryptophan--tRNA ligase, mitochondrial [Microbotryomycetes sp. JL221]
MRLKGTAEALCCRIGQSSTRAFATCTQHASGEQPIASSSSSTIPSTIKPATTPRRQRVIFSGIQPTGVPHIGNHLGALSQWQKLVTEVSQQPKDSRDKLFFSVVGLHALTVPQDPALLKRERHEMFAVLLALGLSDPAAGAVIFHQDQVPEHAELAWYLNCITSVNKLMRMTSWKSKLATLRNANSEDEVDDSMLQLGLLAYPVLQAADVLLYETTHVPVGHDQSQHLELARDTAIAFNRMYPGRRKDGKGKGKGVFRVPEVMLTTHPRIQSLRNPLQKMSKSAPHPSSKILLTDTPEQIHSKIKSAVTDSIRGVTYDPSTRPGVATLLQVYSGYTGESTESIATRFSGDNGIADMKINLAEAVQSSLKSFRHEFARIRTETGFLEQMEREGAQRAREAAQKTMGQVRQVVGTA